jgi:hypothetical protein
MSLIRGGRTTKAYKENQRVQFNEKHEQRLRRAELKELAQREYQPKRCAKNKVINGKCREYEPYYCGLELGYSTANDKKVRKRCVKYNYGVKSNFRGPSPKGKIAAKDKNNWIRYVKDFQAQYEAVNHVPLNWKQALEMASHSYNSQGLRGQGIKDYASRADKYVSDTVYGIPNYLYKNRGKIAHAAKVGAIVGATALAAVPVATMAVNSYRRKQNYPSQFFGEYNPSEHDKMYETMWTPADYKAPPRREIPYFPLRYIDE